MSTETIEGPEQKRSEQDRIYLQFYRKLGFSNLILSELIQRTGPDSEWIAIVQIAAFLEAATTIVLASHINIPALDKRIAELQQSQRVQWLHDIGQLTDFHKRYLISLYQLRNKATHRATNLHARLEEISQQVDNSHPKTSLEMYKKIGELTKDEDTTKYPLTKHAPLWGFIWQSIHSMNGLAISWSFSPRYRTEQEEIHSTIEGYEQALLGMQSEENVFLESNSLSKSKKSL